MIDRKFFVCVNDDLWFEVIYKISNELVGNEVWFILVKDKVLEIFNVMVRYWVMILYYIRYVVLEEGGILNFFCSKYFF